MTTIVDKTPNGTFYRAAKTYPVPDVDILTLLFGKRPSTARDTAPSTRALTQCASIQRD
jgi:hypothetical protein